MSSKLYIDAGTSWSKIILSGENEEFQNKFYSYKIKTVNDKTYYILPSSLIKTSDICFTKATGHMSLGNIASEKDYENEMISLAFGAKKYLKEPNALVFDLGSRD